MKICKNRMYGIYGVFALFLVSTHLKGSASDPLPLSGVTKRGWSLSRLLALCCPCFQPEPEKRRADDEDRLLSRELLTFPGSAPSVSAEQEMQTLGVRAAAVVEKEGGAAFLLMGQKLLIRE